MEAIKVQIWALEPKEKKNKNIQCLIGDGRMPIGTYCIFSRVRDSVTNSKGFWFG
jgi:hypothetical protein